MTDRLSVQSSPVVGPGGITDNSPPVHWRDYEQRQGPVPEARLKQPTIAAFYRRASAPEVTAAGTGASQAADRACRPATSLSNCSCNARVTGPALPEPIVRKSISRSPITSAAVPQTNTSSAM